jgi:hypothetical protein
MAIDPEFLLLDTSYLWSAHPKQPDFQKLLRYSRDRKLVIFVPFIAWEEWRTQQLELRQAEVEALRRAQLALVGRCEEDLIMKGFVPPQLVETWTDEDLVAQSRTAMERFATENRIVIVPLRPDHAERAWGRFFDVRAPFNPGQARENRRKDIPDSWILEAAIDVRRDNPRLMALCPDEPLRQALQEHAIPCFERVQDVLARLEAAEFAAAAEEAAVAVVATPAIADEAEERIEVPASNVVVAEKREPTPALQVVAAENSESSERQLVNALARATRNIEALDRRVLGYVGWYGDVEKGELFELTTRAGIDADAARNAAERLALAGLTRDTGRYYLVEDRELARIAADAIEAEMITLLAQKR